MPVNRIRQLRDERGMTQTDLGILLNVQDAAVSKYEKERVPLTADTLSKLSDIFDVSIDYILCRTNAREPSLKNRNTSLAPSVANHLTVDHPEVFENWNNLDEEGKKKAREYLSMLLVMQSLKNKDNIVDLDTNASNAN
jgi:transcriptional regulator with XRE-family HTH domain